MEAENRTRTYLVERRQKAEQKIQAQIDSGQELVDRQILSEDHIENANAEFENWSKYNEMLLSRLFNNSAIVEQYTDFYGGSYNMMATLGDNIRYIIEEM